MRGWEKRGITPLSPRWMTMVRSEAVQRMVLAETWNALFSFSL